MTSSTWSTRSDYPYGQGYPHRSVSHFAIATYKDDFIIFGGFGSTGTIAKFATKLNKWIRLGNLNSDRYGHSVALLGHQFIVVGGRQTKNTESCELSDLGDSISCTPRVPTTIDVVFYPELFIIPTSYTDQCETN